MANYIIYRDVYTRHEVTGSLCKKIRREYLRITKSGLYVWKNDLQKASVLSINDSIRIMNNLQREVRPSYNYGKIMH